MRVAAGIILLIIGVIYPMATLFWLNGRLRRQPQPTPQRLGLLMTFNFVLPVGLVALGVGLLSAQLWASVSFRWALALVGVFLLALLIVFWRQSRAEGAAPSAPTEDSHG
jgi:hypothetical protein